MAFATVGLGLTLLITVLGVGVIVQAQTDTTATPGAQDIRYGQTVTGQLTADASQDWAFVGTPGDIVRLQIGRTSGDLLLGITIQDQYGRPMAGVQTTDSGGVTLSDVAINQTGVYGIHVFSLAHTAGTFQLTLSNTGAIAASPTPVSQLLAGTIAYGQVVHGAIYEVNYRQLWRFTGTIGDMLDIQMRVTSGDLLSYIALVSPGGEVITTSAAQAGISTRTGSSRDAAIFSIQLPSTGSYQLLAQRQGDQQGRLGLTSGLYDLTITSHSLTANAQDSVLRPGSAVTGRLTGAAPISQYQITTGGTFVLRLNLGNLHRIARIRLLEANGAELYSQSGLSPLTASVTLPAKGPFSLQISADTYDDQLTTDFGLNLYKITTPATPINYASAQYGQAGHDPSRWVFIGQAGDLIRLRVTPGIDAGDASVTLNGPQDATLFQGTIGPAFEQPFTLPTSGTYQVAIQTAKVNTPQLSYQIMVDWDGVVGLPFARFGVTTTSGPLGFDKPLTGTLAPFGSQTWSVDAPVGQTLNITAAAQTLTQPLGILVRAPDETLLAAQYGNGIVQLRRALLVATGRYSVIVFNPTNGETVPYTVQLEDAGGGLLTGSAVKGVILPSNTFAEWSLDATAGTLITAQLTTRTPAAWTAGLLLIDPAGIMLARVGTALGRSSVDLSGIRASVTGRYRLVVMGSVGAAFASYELQASAQTPFTASSGSRTVITTPQPTSAPVMRFSGSASIGPAQLLMPTISDWLDPSLPLDPSPGAVQSMPFDTLLRGEIPAGTLRQVWRAVIGSGITLNLRAVAIDGTRGPDLALFDEKQHIVAEQLHGAFTDTTLSYFTAGGGAYYLAVRLGLGKGRYTLYAESQTLTLGTLQVALGTPLMYGESATGELVTANQPPQIDNFYFFGAFNDVLNISAARVTGDLVPVVQISALSGQLLAANANPSSEAVSVIADFRIPANGVYGIQVRRSAAAQQSNGRYLLTLGLNSSAQLKNHLSGIIQPDQSVFGLLSGNVNQNTWLFSGHAGQEVSFVVTGLSATNSPTPLSLKLQDIAGHTFAQQDVFSTQDSAQLINVMLPNDSLYRVKVTGGDFTQGSYRLQWFSQAVQPNGTLHYGQTVSGLFTATQQAEKWTFAGTVGDVIALSLRRLQGDPFRGAFQILSSGGATLASAADLGNGEGARVDSLSLPFSGTYTVIVVNPDSAYKGAGVYAIGLTLQETKARAVGGLLTDGQTGVGELYPDDPLHTWLVSGHGGDVITVQVAAQDHFLQPEVTLKNTNDQTLDHAVASIGGTAIIRSFKLTADGVYALSVTGSAHSSGSYRITLTFAPPPIAALATIKYGTSTVGLIADDRQTNLYLFIGQPGDKITAQAMREAGSTLAITFELRTDNGVLLARSDALGGELATIADFVLPDSGIYRLIVGRFSGADGHTSGRLTITLNGQPANLPTSGVIKSGQVEQGRVDDAVPAERWTFSGKAGQVVNIRSKATSGDLDTFLTLQSPDKTTIAYNDDFDGTNAVIPGAILPADGRYTITLSRVGTRGHGSAGNYDLQLDTLFTLGSTTAISGTAIGYGQRVVGTVDRTHPEEIWTFEARAGDVVRVLLVHTSDDAPPSLSIQDQSGSILASGLLHVGQTTIDQYQLPTSGLYNISIKRPINARAAFSPYALSLILISGMADTTIGDGGVLPTDGSVIGQLAAGQALNLWLIQATAGQTLTLNLTPLTGDLTTEIQVIDPGGRLLLNSSTTLDSGNHNLRVDSLELPVGGLYTVVITPRQAGQNGTYRLISHLQLAADPSASLRQLLPGQTMQSSLTDLQPTERWQFKAISGEVINAQLLVASGMWHPLLQLLSADGQLIAAGQLNQTPFGMTAVIESAHIPIGGSYILLVGRTGVESGNYALTFGVDRLISVQALAASPITYGQVVQAIVSPARAALWAFDARYGDVVDVIVQPAAVGSVGTALDAPRLTVEDTAGHVIFKASPIVHESSAAALVLPGTGRYVIALDSDSTGGYSLMLQNRPASPPVKFTARTLVNGKTQQNGIDTGALTDYWTFNAKAGDGVQIQLARLSGDLRLSASLYGPNGYLSGSAADAKTASIMLGALSLPDTGSYTVVVSRWLGLVGKTTGRYSITLSSVSAPAPTATPDLSQNTVAVPLLSSQPAAGLIDHGILPLNTTVETEMSADQIGHVWTFDAQASPTIATEIVSKSASLTLHAVVIGANGIAIGHASTDSTGRLSLEMPLVFSGHYTLQVLPDLPGQAGRYRLRVIYALTALGGGRLVSDGVVSGTLSAAHFTDNWRFDAQQDSLLHIDAQLTNGDVGLEYILIDPAGNQISPTADTVPQADPGSKVLRATIRVSTDGTYALLISRQGGPVALNVMTYQLTIHVALPTF